MCGWAVAVLKITTAFGYSKIKDFKKKEKQKNQRTAGQTDGQSKWVEELRAPEQKSLSHVLVLVSNLANCMAVILVYSSDRRKNAIFKTKRFLVVCGWAGVVRRLTDQPIDQRTNRTTDR